MARGKRKFGVPRDSKGRIAYGHDREKPEDAKAVALDARIRNMLGVDAWLKLRDDGKALKEQRRKVDKDLLGYALGRLYYTEQITEAQHDAGRYFIGVYLANARIRGWPSPNIRSPGAEMVAKGMSCHAEDTDEWVFEMRRKFQDITRAIYDMRQEDVFEGLKRALIEDLDPINPDALGALKAGLNEIARIRGLDRG